MRKAWNGFRQMSVLARIAMICAYLLVGTAFGSWNYSVFAKPTSHSYSARLMLFPWTTALNEAWLCTELNGGGCLIRAEKHFVINLPELYSVMYPEKKMPNNLKRDYTMTLALVWPLKVVANFFSLLILYAMSVCMWVVSFVGVVAMLIAGALRLTIVYLFSLIT